MSVQPCGCDMTELAWPYAHATIDPADDNGIKCGVDKDGETIVWSYPDHDVVHSVATKGSALGLSAGAWISVGSVNKRAGAVHLTGDNVFTAPIDGMYDVTWKLENSDATAFQYFLRVTTTHAGWVSPLELKVAGDSVAFLGGGITVAGVLPALATETLTFELYHNKSGGTAFKEIFFSCSWRSPIPT